MQIKMHSIPPPLFTVFQIMKIQFLIKPVKVIYKKTVLMISRVTIKVVRIATIKAVTSQVVMMMISSQIE